MSEIPPPQMSAPPAGMPPPKKNTTLIIVIVVSSVLVLGCIGIAILAAILFPVFSQAKEAALTTSCLSNTRQLAVAQMIYSNDYDGQFGTGERWMDISLSYGALESVLKCPKLRQAGEGQYGYAMNSDVTGKKEIDIAVPGSTPLVFESADTSRNALAHPEETPMPGRHRKGGSNGSNVAFCDSSARFVPDGQKP